MPETFTNNLLRIQVSDENDSITVTWFGKSIMRNPGGFITPILVDVMSRGSDDEKRIILDFRKLEYMNSSSITPVIKILERARRGINQVTVLYEKSLRWQYLSFSALEIFETGDRRVEIKGS